MFYSNSICKTIVGHFVNSFLHSSETRTQIDFQSIGTEINQISVWFQMN